MQLESTALAFRHELARRAVEDALAPGKRQAAHGRILASLQARSGDVAIARLVHHAEAAGDIAAVLRFAPDAARHAAAVGAHREAAAHYASALKYAGQLSLDVRADLLAGRAVECYLTDEPSEAVLAEEAALAIWQDLGNARREGDAWRRLSRLHWVNGQTQDANRCAAQAIAVLEPVGPGAELAMAYSNQGQLHTMARNTEAAIAWSERAIELAEAQGNAEVLCNALNNLGTAKMLPDRPGGREALERSLRIALEHGLHDHVARAYTNLGYSFLIHRRYAPALEAFGRGIAYCEERDLDAWAFYMTAERARAFFEQGDWARAAAEAGRVLARPRGVPLSRIAALVAQARVRTRRGDPGVRQLLDEAKTIAEGTAEQHRMARVAAARAELAWHAGDTRRVVVEATAAYDMSVAVGDAWSAGELAFWLWRAGALADPPAGSAAPFALQIGGDWAQAAAAWRTIGCPYEEALALSDSERESDLRRALTLFTELGAGPAAATVRQRLRIRGVRNLPTGARTSTRRNPGGLTTREVEILGRLAQGLTNAEIADRLCISPKTVDHHVSAILSKLGLRSRTEAALALAKLGIAPPAK
jgi:DNA-binding CsgD family transcriptional regulator/tetratricopeptide (TPR) repeat protein